MNSARAVAQKMKDMKISDRSFFTSPAFSGFLETLLSIPCRMIGRRVPKCKMIFDLRPNAPVAYTDDITIVINAGHSLVRTQCKNRKQRTRLIIGFMIHEYGHYRFTDAAAHQTALQRLSSGKFYPAFRGKLTTELQKAREMFETYFSENPEKIEHIKLFWHQIYNIMEDAYIEESLYHSVTGQLIDGLAFARQTMLSTSPTLAEMLEELEEDRRNLIPIIENMMLIYGKFGTTKCNYKNEDECCSEPMRILKECMPYINRLVTEKRSKIRLADVHRIFLVLWPYYMDLLESMPATPEAEETSEELKEFLKKFSKEIMSEDYKGSAHGTIPVSEEEDTGVSGSSKERDETAAEMEAEKEECDRTDALEESSDDDPADDEIKSDAKEEKDGETRHDISELKKGEYHKETIDDEFDPAHEKELEAALRKMETDLRSDLAIMAVNDDLKKEIEDEAAEIDYGTSMGRSAAKITRISSVNEETKESYAALAKPLEEIARTMVRKVLPKLKSDENEEFDYQKGFYCGKRFEASRIIRDDYRYYSRQIMPVPDENLALTVLVDESGSMDWRGRMEAAQLAALTLYLFCSFAGIKCSVIGHTEEYRGDNAPVFNVYADFETPDKNDKYRIMSMKARENNRDGAALRFAGYHLAKREEAIKLMIVISDGEPAAYNYNGEPAIKDMRAALTELRRQGIIVFAAAIGDDRDVIQSIYGNGFLAIDDLNTLPNQLLQLVKRFVRK